MLGVIQLTTIRPVRPEPSLNAEIGEFIPPTEKGIVMPKRKPLTLLLVITGLLFLSLNCATLTDVLPKDPAREPDPAPVESPSPQAESPPQEAPPDTPSESTNDGFLTELLGLVSENPLLLIVPLLLLALILILILMLRPRKKRTGKLATQDPSGSGSAARKGTAELVRVPSLTYLSDSGSGVSVPLKDGPITIGRADDNDLVIDDRFSSYETVSETHARLYQRAGYWIIKDLDSDNGVYVNRQRTGHNILQEGWQVSIGSVTFKFHTEKKGAAA